MEELASANELETLRRSHGHQTVGNRRSPSFTDALGKRGYNNSDAVPLLSATCSVGTSIF